MAVTLRHANPVRVRQLARRVELVAQCLRDLARGAYPHVPWKTVTALLGALTYLVNPFDAVPDLVPLTGLLDDAVVLAMVFGAAESDLRRYCAWAGIDPEPYFGE